MPRNVQVSRYIDALRKQLGVQSHVGLNLVDDCLPVWPMYSDAPETFLLREEFRYSLAFSLAAVAGQYGRVHITLPAVGALRQGNRLFVLESVRPRGTDVIYGWDTVAGATAVTAANTRLDRRNTTEPTLLTTADNNAADSLSASMGVAQSGFEVALGVVMSPAGTPFGFRTYAVNQQLDMTLVWREFIPSDEELRG